MSETGTSVPRNDETDAATPNATDGRGGASHVQAGNAGEGAGPPFGPSRPPNGFFRSPAAKFFAIAFLVGLLLVPILFVWALTQERDWRREEVLRVIDSDWGGAQRIRGPYLAVPFKVATETVENGRTRRSTDTRTAILLPDRFNADVTVDTSIRSISIFDAVVYGAAVTAEGAFPALSEADFGEDVSSIAWDEARLVIDVSSIGGIEEVKLASSLPGAGELQIEPGSGLRIFDEPAVHALLPVTGFGAGTTGIPRFTFDLTLRVRGNAALDLSPVGRETTVTMTSNWQHPAFQGRILPSAHEVNDSGFVATWRVPYLTRTTGQFFVAELMLDRFNGYGQQWVGLRLDDPVDFYALVERALKYGVMFVAAVFGIVFLLEILSTKRIHVVQYTLVGMLVVFFYVLLLALSEQIGFAYAYLAASTATGGVVAAFVGTALASWSRAAIAAVGFAGLFALLYSILRLEDVALLAGAVTGFVALTLVLFATRKVDWSGSKSATATAA